MPGERKAVMFVNSDFSDLLRLFNANSVEYLVIGGYALIQYAEPRYTKDLDLWISTDTENASAVYQSLQSFGAPLESLTQKDFANGAAIDADLSKSSLDPHYKAEVKMNALESGMLSFSRVHHRGMG